MFNPRKMNAPNTNLLSKLILSLLILLTPLFVISQNELLNPLAEFENRFADRASAIEIMEKAVNDILTHPVYVNNLEKDELYFPLVRKLKYYTAVKDDLILGETLPDAICKRFFEQESVGLKSRSEGYQWVKIDGVIALDDPLFIGIVQLLVE